MKHSAVIHSADCLCRKCRELRVQQRRGRPLLPDYVCVIVAAVAFWAVPGRWLLSQAWAGIAWLIPLWN